MVVHALLICLNWAHYPFVKLNVSMVFGYVKTLVGAFTLDKDHGGNLNIL